METHSTKTTPMPNGASNPNHFNMEHLKDSAGKWLEISKENGSEMVEKSVEMAKRYPVHTALGVGAVGVVTGFLIGKLFK